MNGYSARYIHIECLYLCMYATYVFLFVCFVCLCLLSLCFVCLCFVYLMLCIYNFFLCAVVVIIAISIYLDCYRTTNQKRMHLLTLRVAAVAAASMMKCSRGWLPLPLEEEGGEGDRHRCRGFGRCAGRMTCAATASTCVPCCWRRN